MIRLEFSGAVATLTLDRPPVNAVNEQWIGSLDRALDRIEARADVAIIHLRSALRVFCAGADLSMMSDLLREPAGRDHMIGAIRSLQRVYARLESSSRVSIAELGGAAMGGGLELALACDLRVAAEDARLGLPEIRLGLLPAGGGTQRLTRICGRGTALRLILRGESLSGAAALELGLVQWVQPAAQLADWTRNLARELAALPAPALAACKRCIRAEGAAQADGFELELTETRFLHDEASTRKLIADFLRRGK